MRYGFLRMDRWTHKTTLQVAAFVGLLLVHTAPVAGQQSVYDLTLQELSRLRISSGATLTKTEARKVPASVTTITRTMISESGARSLDELLDVYVPNFTRLRQGATGPDFGMRGIIHSRDNKTLMIVNGRIMNHRALFGAISERFLPLLGDIESIEVVRGPGSAVYGPGAINGVINIRTRVAEGVTSFEADLSRGFAESYTLGEMRLARALGTKADVSVYYGIDGYRGASPADAPLVFSRTRSLNDSTDLFIAGVPVDTGIIHDNRAMEDRAHHKAHMQLRYGDTQAWARFVQGSTQYLMNRGLIEGRQTFEGSSVALQYRQLTLQAQHVLALAQTLDLHLRASYDTHDVLRQHPGKPVDRDYASAMREREINLRQMVSWSPHAYHSLAVGVDYSREWFGEDPGALTDDPAHDYTTNFKPWTTNTIGVLGEYQWNASANWTAFLGGRADRHTFTKWMYSPKAAVVFSPTDRYTAKLLYNQSVRKSEDIELKAQSDADPATDGDTEKIKSLEFRHEGQIREDVSVSVAALWHRFDSIGYAGEEVRRTQPIGRSHVAGLEVELDYRSISHTIAGSYAFTKLLDYQLADERSLSQRESSAPYGYGNDLHNWPRHVGKLTWRWRPARMLTAVSSLRLFWGYQGAQNYAEYNNEVLQQNGISRTDDGRTEAFQGSAFLNIGTIYDTGRGVQLSLHTYNILGWLHYGLNKRNFFGRMAGYRSEAPALSVRLGLGL